MDFAVRREARRLYRGDLAFEYRQALRVFVAQINVGLGGLDYPGGDQHAFEKAVRVGFEKIAVLKGARLTLVGIDRHQAGRRLLAHEAPLAPGRKPCTAEPAQTRMLQDLDQLFALTLSGEAGPEQVIAARRAIGVKADKFRDRRVGLAGRDA